ncbi:hypothetical protein P8452_10486 [Trifolium repens]|nr:hypothetical protein P8452_10486 [Trifolium repens]
MVDSKGHTFRNISFLSSTGLVLPQLGFSLLKDFPTIEEDSDRQRGYKYISDTFSCIEIESVLVLVHIKKESWR